TTSAVSRHVAGRTGPAAVALGLAVLARPESLLLLPLLWLAGPLTLRRAAVYAAVLGGLLTPWVLFNLTTSGRPLPATASAKISGGVVGLLMGIREPVATMLVWRPWRFEMDWARWLMSVDVLLPVLVPIGLVALWRVRGRAAGLPALLLVLHPIGMAILAPSCIQCGPGRGVDGPGFQEGRYSIH